MKEHLQKKYGLSTAIALVVGIVIGSGVFFKAESVLSVTGGDLPTGILAWIIGGLIMLFCVLMFSVMAGKYEKVNGIVDYAEATVGKKYAYMLGWFMTVIYYPTLASVLSWLSARYTLVLFGQTDYSSGLCLALSALFLVTSYAINALSPIIAGKFQVGATVIKLIPLLLMAIAGTIAGVLNGNLSENFFYASNTATGSHLFSGVVSTAFAYEGWIIATSINAELKNAKKNLPIALIGGSLIIISIYILYYIGLAGSVKIDELTDPSKGVRFAFSDMFGSFAGAILTAFIAVSCMGTLNGIMLGCTRGMYSISLRMSRLDLFKTIDPKTNMPVNSSVFGIFLCGVWLFYFYGANLWKSKLFGPFSFDSSELPIVTLYAMYIPIFIMFIKKSDEANKIKRYALPILASISSSLMVLAAVYAHGVTPFLAAKEMGFFELPILFYIIVFTVIMASGEILSRLKKSSNE